MPTPVIDKFVYADIVKFEDNEDGTLHVFGKVTDEITLDSGKQVTDAATFQPALKKWAQTWANIREMHQPSTVGIATEVAFQADSSFAGADIIDPLAITKVKRGLYKGFSYGLIKGTYDVVDRGNPKHPGGRIVLKSDDAIAEISLVDHPSHPGATLAIAKLPDVEVDLTKDAGEETQDATLAEQAISLIQAMIAREATEDDPDGWDLRMLVDVLTTLQAFKTNEQWEALQAAMTKAAAGEEIDVDKATIVTIVEEVLAQHGGLTKAAGSEIDIDGLVTREEFDAVKVELSDLAKSAAPAAVYRGGALVRAAAPQTSTEPKPDPERARYEGLRNSSNPDLRRAARDWLAAHSKE